MALLKCSDPPASVASDAGVAGVGVLLSFIITAVIALTISASLIFQEARGRAHRNNLVLRRKLLGAYSDQQILTGIGLQSVGLAKINTLVPYHFFIIWMLSLLSMACHNAGLLALVHDYRRDWVLRWLRQVLIFVNLVLSSVYGVFILLGVEDGVANSTLPIGCVLQSNVDVPPISASSKALSTVGTIVVIAGNAIVFILATWYLHSRRQRYYKAVQIVGLVLMVAISIGAIIRVSFIADAFSHKPPIVLSDDGEVNWSFGQLLSIGMLLLPLVSIIEILRGEIQCAPPVADAGEDKSRLLGDNELQSHSRVDDSFQPNPLFQSRSNLFKK